MRIPWLCGSAFFLAGGCFVPEATIESTTSSGSSGSSMETSTVSSGTGMDPRVWALTPGTVSVVSYGATGPTDPDEIAQTGNPMQHHLLFVPLPQPNDLEGYWYAFTLHAGAILASRFLNGDTWDSAGSVAIDNSHALLDGRTFGADVDPLDRSLLHFAADWQYGSVHIEARAPDDPAQDVMFSPPQPHATTQGLEQVGAITVPMGGGLVYDFGVFKGSAIDCESCVATRTTAAANWVQSPLDIETEPDNKISPRGAVRIAGTPIVAWPKLSGLLQSHIAMQPDQWGTSPLDKTEEAGPERRNWAMCSKPVPDKPPDAHLLIASGTKFTHLFTSSGSWNAFQGEELALPSGVSEITEFTMVCSADFLYAFTIDPNGVVLGTRFDVANKQWSYWTEIKAAPSPGLQRCFLSGFDQATHGSVGLIFTETDDCTKKRKNTYYSLFIRIG